ncbi:MAG: exosortase H [Bacteroidota bacterium]
MAQNRADRRRKSKDKKAGKGSGGGMAAGLGAWWKQFQEGKSPIFIFLLKFLAVLIPFYILWFTPFFKENILASWNALNATVSSVILNIFGAGTVAAGDMLTGPSGSIRIYEGCDGIEPTMLLIAGIVAFPAALRYKWRGILYGSLFLLGTNLLRIISLYLVQIWWPSGFEFMHREFWQVAFILLAIVAWVYWMRKSPIDKEESHANMASEPA